MTMLSVSFLFAVSGMVSSDRTLSLSYDEQHMCSINGPENSGLSWTFGLPENECKVRCLKTRYEADKISSAFANHFTADIAAGSCYCKNNQGEDMLPPHKNLRACGKDDCWSYYRNVMSKVLDLPFTNFWTPQNDCAACGGLDQPECDTVTIDKGFGMDALRKLETGSAEDRQLFETIVGALKQQRIAIPDEFRWSLADGHSCDKACADEKGPGKVVGEYICEKRIPGSTNWDTVDVSECADLGSAPEFGNCAEDPCRAVWTTEVSVESNGDKQISVESNGDTLDNLEGYTGGQDPAVSEGAWGPCTHGCIKSGENPEDAKQKRIVRCVVENGPSGSGKWETRGDETCRELSPSDKPDIERVCAPPPEPCFKWVTVTKCYDHTGAVVDDENCAGSA